LRVDFNFNSAEHFHPVHLLGEMSSLMLRADAIARAATAAAAERTAISWFGEIHHRQVPVKDGAGS
jgi:hypothetical protein